MRTRSRRQVEPVTGMFDTILVCDDGGSSGRDALRVARYLSMPQTRFVLTSADSPARLLHTANEERADLIVLPAGGSATRLLHGSHVPVVLAPAGYADGAEDRVRVIGVGFDGQQESRAALHVAEELALEHAATMRVYSVVQPHAMSMSRIEPTPAEYRAALRESLDGQLREAVGTLDSGVRAAASVLRGDPARILAEASREGLDLLVVGSRGQGRMSRVLLGSVSSELVDRVDCPLLVLPRTSGPNASQDEPPVAVPDLDQEPERGAPEAARPREAA